MSYDFKNLEWVDKPTATKEVKIEDKREKAIQSNGTKVFYSNGSVFGSVKYGTSFVSFNDKKHFKLAAMSEAEFNKAKASIEKQLKAAITQGDFDSGIEANSAALSEQRLAQAA